MAFDFINLVVGSTDEFLTGQFYRRRPVNSDDGAISFHYKQRDPNSKIFSTVLSGIRADSASYAITTNDYHEFNVGGYIVTQNGLAWEIVEVILNEQPNESADALRWFRKAKTAECSVRMIQVTDLFNVKESYNTECEIELTFNKRIASATVSSSAMYNIANNGIWIYVDKNTEVEAFITFDGGSEYKVELSKDQTNKDKYEATYNL